MPEKSVDVLIVGAGPAGLSAALALKARGVDDVLVVDRDEQAGGVPRLCHHPGFGIKDLKRIRTGPGYAKHYVSRVLESGISLWTGTTVTGWEDGNTLSLTRPQGLSTVRAKAILLATGCRERPRAARLVPGSRPLGIFTTGSLQDFVHGYHLPVGKKAVIVGAELVSFSAILTLRRAGVRPVLMVTDLPSHQAAGIYRPFKLFASSLLARVPIAAESRIAGIVGYPRVSAVQVQNADGETRTIPCDTVVFSGDWIPDHELARRGGLEMNEATRGPVVDPLFRTSKMGVFAAGNLLRGAERADDAAIEGRLAAQSIAGYLEREAWPESRIPLRVSDPIQWVSPNALSGHPDEARASFLFRVKSFQSHTRLVVRQAGRMLYEKTFRRLTPNLSARFSAEWVAQVEPDGEDIQLELL